jgi:hypothetical protein
MININLSEIIGLGESFDQISKSVLDENIKQGLVIAGAAVQSEARGLVPTDTGALRISITNSVGEESLSGVSAVVGPTQPYGKDIEFGRPPGTYVSPVALMGWAKRKGLNPYAVSRSIQNKGSPAQPFMFPAADNQLSNVIKIISQAVVNAFSIL